MKRFFLLLLTAGLPFAASAQFLDDSMPRQSIQTIPTASKQPEMDLGEIPVWKSFKNSYKRYDILSNVSLGEENPVDGPGLSSRSATPPSAKWVGEAFGKSVYFHENPGSGASPLGALSPSADRDRPPYFIVRNRVDNLLGIVYGDIQVKMKPRFNVGDLLFDYPVSFSLRLAGNDSLAVLKVNDLGSLIEVADRLRSDERVHSVFVKVNENRIRPH